jgi:DNA mismatch repair protein MutL
LLQHPLLTLSPDETAVVDEKARLIEDIGFSFEITEDGVSLGGIPSILDGFDPARVFCETVENIRVNRQNPLPDIVDGIYHMLACKSAIKSGDVTSVPEMEQIIKTLLENANIRYCPHGRPVMFKLDKRELEKKFKRS